MPRPHRLEQLSLYYSHLLLFTPTTLHPGEYDRRSFNAILYIAFNNTEL